MEDFIFLDMPSRFILVFAEDEGLDAHVIALAACVLLNNRTEKLLRMYFWNWKCIWKVTTLWMWAGPAERVNENEMQRE